MPLCAVLIRAGCAGTTTDAQSIMALSTPELPDCVLDSFRASFYYQVNSMDSKKVGKNRHILAAARPAVTGEANVRRAEFLGAKTWR